MLLRPLCRHYLLLSGEDESWPLGFLWSPEEGFLALVPRSFEGPGVGNVVLIRYCLYRS